MASSFSLPLLSHPKAPIALSLLLLPLLLLASLFYSRQSLPFPSPALKPNPNYSISLPPLHPPVPLPPLPPPDDDSVAEDEDEDSTSVLTSPPSAEEPSIFEQGFAPAGDRGGVVMQSREAERCDLYKGTWVRDEEGRHPLYSAGSCPYVDEAFSCQGNGREDDEYLKWRWKQDNCELPRFNATDFLERLRGKRLMLVGDSMNRNQFESMLCILQEALPDKSRMYETRGYKITKGRGCFIFFFEDYNCTVTFVRSHFLVREGTRVNRLGNSNPILMIDRICKSSTRWKGADILIFNTGQWWAHGKTSRGKDYYKEGDVIYPQFDATEAFKRSIQTWGRWIDRNMDPAKILIFYRGYSTAHFRFDDHLYSLLECVYRLSVYIIPLIIYFLRENSIYQILLTMGGDWDSGGTCHGETSPALSGPIIDNYPLKMKIIEEVLNKMNFPVILLNVTKLTNFRKDAHPSIYGKMVTKGQKVSKKRQDCSHWCLPGVPDAWNELIYATLVLDQRSEQKP